MRVLNNKIKIENKTNITYHINITNKVSLIYYYLHKWLIASLNMLANKIKIEIISRKKKNQNKYILLKFFYSKFKI
jgi:hypothetical protein